MSAWASMGGYAAYVWPAYGVSIGGILLAVYLTLRGWHQAQARLALLEQAEGEGR